MKKMIYLLVGAVLILSSCSQAASTATPPASANSPATSTQGAPATGGTEQLTVMTHDSFAASASVIQAFENQYHAKVQFIKSGDAGTALNKAILSKNNPFADVFYGVDNTFLSRALDEGIYEPYNSPVLKDIPNEFKLDPQNGALPVDYGDVCLNYDKNYFKNHNLTPPQTLDDLTKPEYKGLLVVENPATSSPGLAFLLTTIGHFGANGYLDYWKKLVQNNVAVVDGWETAYYTNFSGASGKGQQPIVVSYDSSPAFEIVGVKNPPPEPTTAAIVTDDTCFRQIEFVGILKGTKHLKLAQEWVDFMLSTQFQEDMPLQMYVFPVNPNAKIDPLFTKYLVLPKKTAQVSPQDIAANRQKWLEDWRSVVLH